MIRIVPMRLFYFLLTHYGMEGEVCARDRVDSDSMKLVLS